MSGTRTDSAGSTTATAPLLCFSPESPIVLRVHKYGRPNQAFGARVRSRPQFLEAYFFALGFVV